MKSLIDDGGCSLALLVVAAWDVPPIESGAAGPSI